MTAVAVTLGAEERERLARATADHIVNVLMPGHDRLAGEPGVVMAGDPDAGRPRDAEGIARHLLSGHVWISWMDDTVFAAMRKLHGKPAGSADVLFGSDAYVDLERAQRVAGAQAYRVFRDGDDFCVVAASSAEDWRRALAIGPLRQAVSWILDGCSEETTAAAWTYLNGGGADEDWPPFDAS